jgi:nitrogen fixation-related uncharacterized protein
MMRRKRLLRRVHSPDQPDVWYAGNARFPLAFGAHGVLQFSKEKRMGFLQSLPDGWTIYVWLFAGALIILAAIAWMRWGYKNEQFDEDIKYVVFNDGDQDKMSAEEFAKYKSVMEQQLASRERHLAAKAAEKAARQGA